MVSSRQRSLRFLLRYPRRKPPSRYKISLARAAAISFPLHAAVHAVSSRRRINATLSTINIPVTSSYWPEATNSSEADTWKHTPPFRSQDLAIPANDMFPCFHRRGLSEVIRHTVRARFFRWHDNHHLLFKCAKDTALFQCSTTL